MHRLLAAQASHAARLCRRDAARLGPLRCTYSSAASQASLDYPVIVVGAGPTGLVLSCLLSQYGESAASVWCGGARLCCCGGGVVGGVCAACVECGMHVHAARRAQWLTTPPKQTN